VPVSDSPFPFVNRTLLCWPGRRAALLSSSVIDMPCPQPAFCLARPQARVDSSEASSVCVALAAGNTAARELRRPVMPDGAPVPGFHLDPA